MKRFFLFFAFLFVLQNYAQTAEQIIEKNLDITGGVSQWKSFNSAILKGNILLGSEGNYPVEIYQKRPNLTKTVMKLSGRSIIINGYTGKKAMQYNFETNILETLPNYSPESFDSDLLDYNSKGFEVALMGVTRINEVDCYKIKLTKNTNSITYFFDMKNYQLVREIDSEEIRTYSDFRKVSGLTFPFKINILSTKDGSSFDLNFRTIEVNKAIPTKEFDF